MFFLTNVVIFAFLGGVYASPSMAGSRCVAPSAPCVLFYVSLGWLLNPIWTFILRPGALIAGTWAAMQYMGQECVEFI